MAYSGIACIDMDDIAMAYMIMAFIDMADIVTQAASDRLCTRAETS